MLGSQASKVMVLFWQDHHFALASVSTLVHHSEHKAKSDHNH